MMKWKNMNKNLGMIINNYEMIINNGEMIINNGEMVINNDEMKKYEWKFRNDYKLRRLNEGNIGIPNKVGGSKLSENI